jgi:hypothetical protein
MSHENIHIESGSQSNVNRLDNKKVNFDYTFDNTKQSLESRKKDLTNLESSNIDHFQKNILNT